MILVVSRLLNQSPCIGDAAGLPAVYIPFYGRYPDLLNQGVVNIKLYDAHVVSSFLNLASWFDKRRAVWSLYLYTKYIGRRRETQRFSAKEQNLRNEPPTYAWSALAVWSLLILEKRRSEVSDLRSEVRDLRSEVGGPRRAGDQ